MLELINVKKNYSSGENTVEALKEQMHRDKEEYRARHAKYRAEHIEEIRAHDRERYRLKKEKEAMAV